MIIEKVRGGVCSLLNNRQVALSSTPHAFFVVKFERGNHFGVAVNAVSAVDVCSVGEDFSE